MPNRIAVELNIEHLERTFWDAVQIGRPDECWPWMKSVGSHGYGQAWDGVTVRLAHRCAWTLTHGAIPEGMTIDHLCRFRPCCNPSHMRLLTNLANATDNGKWGRTECFRGHPWNDENTYTDRRGHRHCRACARLTRKAKRETHP